MIGRNINDNNKKNAHPKRRDEQLSGACKTVILPNELRPPWPIYSIYQVCLIAYECVLITIAEKKNNEEINHLSFTVDVNDGQKNKSTT